MNPDHLASTHHPSAPRPWPYAVAAFLGRVWRARFAGRQADTARADLLVRALLQSLPSYPADGVFAAGDELVIDDSAAHRRYVIPLGPGRTTWLHRLIEVELATHRNARPGGSGQCEHCRGSGLAAPF